MNAEDIMEYCLAKKGVETTFPFDQHTLVFKVMGKMFALIGLERMPLSINLKCQPEWAEELREKYSEITPGYHMNKVHWNTVLLEGSLEIGFIQNLIDHSYELVVKSLPKKVQSELYAQGS